MSNRFTMRPALCKHESLTSYIGRIAECNGYKYRDVIKYLIPKNLRREITIGNIYQLDMLPRRVSDNRKLCELLGKDLKQLEAHTFTPAIDKLIINDNAGDDVHRTSLLMKTVNTRYRNICPVCVRDAGVFSLLWQVKGINICDQHFIKLESECPNCQNPIVYISEHLNQYKCSYCGFNLMEIKEEKEYDPQIIKEQMELYKQWYFLLNPENRLISLVDGLTKEQMLAMVMLYTAQQCNRSHIDKKSIKYFGDGYSGDLIRKASGISDKYQIRLHTILDLLNKANISIEKFSRTTVPHSYIKSVIEYFNKPENMPVGPCLSPWCKAYNTTNTIKQVEEYGLYKENYKVGSICTECYMKFGYNRENNNWESMKNEVDLIWNKVKPLIDRGIPKKQIKKELKIGIDSVYKIYSYLSYHKIIEDPRRNDYKENIHSLVEKFKVIIEQPGDMCSNSYHLYGWSKPEYYYYSSDKNVQNFLIFNSNQMRKKYASTIPKDYDYWKNKIDEAISQCQAEGKEITCDNITNSIGCIMNTLKKHKLDEYINDAKSKQFDKEKTEFRDKVLKIADDYFTSLDEEGKSAVLGKIFELADITDRVIRRKYPDIALELCQKVNKYNEKLILHKNTEELNIILDAIKTLEDNGQAFKKGAVSRITGFSMHVINKRLKMLQDKD